MLAAFEYEKNLDMKTLQPFFDSSLPNIQHPEVKQWGQDLLLERENHRQGDQVSSVSTGLCQSSAAASVH